MRESRPSIVDPEPRGLITDRLPGDGLSITVEFKADRGEPAGLQLPRSPHRHAYHELIWNRRGVARTLIDGRSYPIQPETVTFVGCGQVHVFESGRGLSGAIVRFTNEALGDHGAGGSFPAWLLEIDSSRTIRVPHREVPQLEGVLRMLDDESRRSTDGLSLRLQHHLLSGLLLMLLRWRQAGRAHGDPEARDAQLYRRFRQVLEEDFAHHHDTQHYADALHVPASALTRSLARVSGRTTKELVTDRVMLEAARLLRFTDLTVGEIAFRAGFHDQFYFSRAFKRRYHAAPLAYRAHSRGIAATATHAAGAHRRTADLAEKSMGPGVLPIPSA